jgi:hypothetical protein
VAWYHAAAGSSVVYHRELRQRVTQEAKEGMGELASLARDAALAFAAGDARRLAALVGESGRVRNTIAPLSSAHQRLADAVAGAGLEPNSAGSGGAVAAVVTDDACLGEATRAVRAMGGAVVVETYGAAVR